MIREVPLAREIVVDHRAALADEEIGNDPLLLDAAAARSVVAGDGELHAASVLELDDGLHAALAERGRSDHHRARVILQGARYDLAGASRAAVDEKHDRIVRLGVLGVGPLDFGMAPAPALGGDDDAVEE